MFVAKTRFSDSICILFFQPADKKKFPYGGMNVNRPVTPPRGGNQKKGKKQAEPNLSEVVGAGDHAHFEVVGAPPPKLFMTTTCQEIMKFLCDQTYFFLSRTTILYFPASLFHNDINYFRKWRPPIHLLYKRKYKPDLSKKKLPHSTTIFNNTLHSKEISCIEELKFFALRICNFLFKKIDASSF